MKYIVNDFPKFVANKASGAYIYADKPYIDTCLGSGTHILGHHKLYIDNCLYGASNDLLEQWEDLVHQFLPFFDRYVLCNTGSEATMRACRLARAYTKKDTIAIFEGGHHGSADWSQDCAGVPESFKSKIVRLPYNDEKAFEIIKKNRNKIAMVFIEPVQGSNPRDMNYYLHCLKRACRESGVLLGFDEVVTGFRLAKGGGADYFEVAPDIATYGKILGGGLPIGMVAGRKEIMETQGVFLGGTFSGNPATIQASISILEQLTDSIYLYLNANGKYLRDNIKNMIGCGSMNRLIFTNKPIKSRKERDKYESQEARKRFYKRTLENGIYVGANGLTFLSSAHTEKELRKIVEVFNQ